MKTSRIYDMLMSVAGHLHAAADECEMLAQELPRAPPHHDQLSIKVDVLELSVRTSNCLQNLGIVTLGDLANKTAAEMREAKNLGRKSFKELHEVMEHIGLHFREPEA